jgi:hypothetical protein
MWKIVPNRVLVGALCSKEEMNNPIIVTPKEGPAVVVTVATGDELDQY